MRCNVFDWLKIRYLSLPNVFIMLSLRIKWCHKDDSKFRNPGWILDHLRHQQQNLASFKKCFHSVFRRYKRSSPLPIAETWWGFYGIAFHSLFLKFKKCKERDKRPFAEQGRWKSIDLHDNILFFTQIKDKHFENGM